MQPLLGVLGSVCEATAQPLGAVVKGSLICVWGWGAHWLSGCQPIVQRPLAQTVRPQATSKQEPKLKLL